MLFRSTKHDLEQVVAGNEAFQIVLRDGPGGAGKPDSHVAGPLHGSRLHVRVSLGVRYEAATLETNQLCPLPEPGKG